MLSTIFCSGGCGNGNGPASDKLDVTREPRTADSVESSIPLSPGNRSLHFSERTATAGVEYIYRNGVEAEQLAILESLGGGVAILDYDQDGNPDLFFPGGGRFDDHGQVAGRPCGFFRQIFPWQFGLVSAIAGLDDSSHYTHGAATADADNDGFPDIVVTGYGSLFYFHNNGDGTFCESAAIAGLSDRLWSSSAAWGDLNDDGNLDLYVAHYVNWSPENNPECGSIDGKQNDVCPPGKFEPLPDVIYFSLGDGTYRDGSLECGLSRTGKGLGVLIADVDLDGHQDVYVANDTVPNFLYHNTGDGRLQDISTSSGTAVNDRGLPDGSMGIDIGDYNLDCLPDIWVANYERESFALYRNFGGLVFQHVSQATGVTAVGGQFVGWGTVFLDADCDGDEDVFVSCGHVVHFPESAPVRQVPLLFENLKGQRFEHVVPPGSYFSTPHAGRGCATGDLDGDGDLDLVLSNVNEPVALLCNQTQSSNHWVQFRLIGTVSNRDASGAIMMIRTSAGKQIRQVKGGGSYASTCDAWLHFGLGSEDSILEASIHWPSGETQTLQHLSIDCREVIREPIRNPVESP